MDDYISSITQYFSQLFAGVSFQTPTTAVIITICFIVLLLLLSGFASGSEIAFFSLSPKDVDDLSDEKTATDKLINNLREDSERTLATILITNNFVNVTIIMLCNYVFAKLIDFGGNEVLEFLVLTVLLTFILLLFGEILPKIFARQSTLGFCRMAAKGISFFRTLFWPMENLLMKTSVVAEKIVTEDNHVMSVDELEQALELTDKEDIAEEKKILEGIIRFVDETAKEIMTPRKDIVDINIKARFSDVISCIVENNYSRIPVYQDNGDNIRGILYIKDLLPHLGKPDSFRWQSLIRPPYFVPETKKIDALLQEFQENKVHIAIVVDEFGGTSGLVTMEDILEEIVGEINDEYDEETKQFTRLNKNTYVFEGNIPLTDMQKVLDVDDEEFDEIKGEADTLAGLLLEMKGDFPKPHEVFNYKTYRFEVMKVEERRVASVKVVIVSAQEA